MRIIKSWTLCVMALLIVAVNAVAQKTTRTISGRGNDSQGLALPGVTVSAVSPNLQGALTVVTSENGDYILPQLPPGTYTVTFELNSFARQQRTIAVAPTQSVPLSVTMGPAGVSETV